MFYLLWLCVINCFTWITLNENELIAATRALQKNNEEISSNKNFDNENTVIVKYFNAFATNVHLKNTLLITLVEKVIEKDKERLGFQKILEFSMEKEKLLNEILRNCNKS